MSQLRSSRGASGRSGAGRTPARGGQRGGQRGVYVQQPQSDIFVVMLGVALGAMVLGCLFLVLKLNAYGFDISGP